MPKRDHVCFFESSDEAIKAGFRPCKRCRSDLIDYHPMKDIAFNLKQMIEDAFTTQTELNEKIQAIGITQRRLTDIFKDAYGMTPKAYAYSLKLQEAIHLLSNTNMKVIDIAYSAGFGSLSSFYGLFKKEFCATPSEYRKAEVTQNEIIAAGVRNNE